MTMAKLKKKKIVRKIKWTNVILMVLTLSSMMYLFTATFIKTENQQLAKTNEKSSIEIYTVKIETESLMAEIQELRNYNRVVSIATDAGLESHNDTVIIRKGE